MGSKVRRNNNVVSWKPGGKDILGREMSTMYKPVERSSNRKSLDLGNIENTVLFDKSSHSGRMEAEACLE